MVRIASATGVPCATRTSTWRSFATISSGLCLFLDMGPSSFGSYEPYLRADHFMGGGSAPREILGWAMAEHLKVGLCIDALVMALQRCHPGRGLIHHRDRGVPCASGPDRAVLEPHGIQQSMSRRGN